MKKKLQNIESIRQLVKRYFDTLLAKYERKTKWNVGIWNIDDSRRNIARTLLKTK